MTVGIFDGVHRGHQALIERILSCNYISVVVTFRQNHKTENNKLKNILTFRQRLKKLKSLGVQKIVVLDFTEELRQMDGIAFLEFLLKQYNIGFFAIGSDFRCGYQLSTNAQAIQEFFASRNIPVEIVPPIMEGDLPISSSRIRSAIAEGDTISAEKMLGKIGQNIL